MAHQVETMAYTGQKPWHGLGYEIKGKPTPDELLVKAGLDWTVSKQPVFFNHSGQKQIVKDSYVLVRDTDGQVLSRHVTDHYKPVQNSEALEFFSDFVKHGKLTMETAGSLSNGQFVFALASLNKGFTVTAKGKKDEIEGYLLFSNPHKAGNSVQLMFTPIRVVCNNTLTLALNQGSSAGHFVMPHSRKWDPEIAKNVLGLVEDRLDDFEMHTRMLAKTKCTDEQALAYFQQVWPKRASAAANDNDEASRTVKMAQELLHAQPGANLFPGTMWNTFNTVTYMLDHVTGRSQESRVVTSLFGYNAEIKRRALNLAVDAARAA